MKIPGTLYIVATPIGNMEDITLRAIRTLKEVDLILCENQKNSSKLLHHYEIDTESKTFYFGGTETLEWVKSKLMSGENIAYISDSGTPGVSDPGSVLVKYIRQHNLNIVPIPGPSALSTILSVSGFQANPTVFLGFLSDKESRKRKELSFYLEWEGLLVIYESVYRVESTLEIIRDVLPQSIIYVGRELTKLHEEIFEYKEKSEKISLKGEFVILVNNNIKKISKDKKLNTDILN